MMMRETPEVVAQVTIEAPQQTWYSFFTAMLPRATQAQQLPPELQLLPNAGVENVEMYRVHGVTFSTGNIWQLLILQALFPGQTFNTPYNDETIEST